MDALHTGRIFSLQMQAPIVRADMDADYARVMVVARVMGGLNSVELEMLIISDATYTEPPTTACSFRMQRMLISLARRVADCRGEASI